MTVPGLSSVDAHQHFWRVERGDYAWMTPQVGVLYQDYGPSDLAPMLARHRIARTILVQAAETEAETAYLLEVAATTPFVAGVVGSIDMTAPDAADAAARAAANRLLVGVRPMVQDIADDDWLVRADVSAAAHGIGRSGLVFDALVLPRHLSRVLVFLDRHPHLPVVIDHGAKPFIKAGVLDPWRADIAAIGARPTTTCKVSGLVTEAGDDWTGADLRPYVEHLLDVFGPSRLMWGSDWPVVERARGYDAWRHAAVELFEGLSHDEQSAIFGGTAARVYLGTRGRRLEPTSSGPQP